jgi:subtilase family serine protease
MHRLLLIARGLSVALALGLLVALWAIGPWSLQAAAQPLAAPVADLIITRLSVLPEQPVENRNMVVSISVKNQGSGPAEAFVLQWDSKNGSPTPVVSRQISGLGAGESTTITLTYSYPRAGNYLTVATVDSGRDVPETNEANNITILSLTVQQATVDLVITSFTLNPESPVQGNNTQATVVVKNQGNSLAESFVVRWKPTPLTQLSSQVESLDAGESATVTFDFVYPAAGELNTVAIVDALNSIAETNEDNNREERTITVLQAQIDLIITSFSVSPEQPVQGGNTQISVVVKNQGISPSGPFVVQWKPSSSGLSTPGPSTLSQQVSNLDPSDEIKLTFEFSYPDFGNFMSVASVDPLNAVAESNEANNVAILNITVTPGADLVITAFSISPNPTVRGSTTSASITVRNRGIYRADSFSVRWLPKNDSVARFASIDGLQVGESKTVTIEYAYPKAGTFQSSAVADPADRVKESNEDNNTSQTLSVEVKRRQTAVRVTFNNVSVLDGFEDGIDGNGEWTIAMMVLDKSGSCDFAGQNVPGVRCVTIADDAVDNGDNLGVNQSIDVTLVESAPLLVGVLAIEDDSPLAPDSPGFAFKLYRSAEIGEAGSETLPGEQGECDGGHCFDLNYTVSVLSGPPAIAGEDDSVVEEAVLLPDELARLLPPNATLPPGIRRNYWIHLPLTVR